VGEGKTDARDAAIIADQARMRRDLQPLRPGDEITAAAPTSQGPPSHTCQNRSTQPPDMITAGELQ
jgi:hypothetical protein